MSMSPWLMLDAAEEVAVAATEVADTIMLDILVMDAFIDVELDILRLDGLWARSNQIREASTQGWPKMWKRVLGYKL